MTEFGIYKLVQYYLKAITPNENNNSNEYFKPFKRDQ